MWGGVQGCRPAEIFEPVTDRGAANCCFIRAVWERGDVMAGREKRKVSGNR